MHRPSDLRKSSPPGSCSLHETGRLAVCACDSLTDWEAAFHIHSPAADERVADAYSRDEWHTFQAKPESAYARYRQLVSHEVVFFFSWNVTFCTFLLQYVLFALFAPM